MGITFQYLYIKIEIERRKRNSAKIYPICFSYEKWSSKKFKI